MRTGGSKPIDAEKAVLPSSSRPSIESTTSSRPGVEYNLHLFSEAKLGDLDLSKPELQNAIVVCPDTREDSSSSSSSNTKYNAFFIRDGQWVLVKDDFLKIIHLGNYLLDTQKEGLLPNTNNYLRIKQDALATLVATGPIFPAALRPALLFKGEKWIMEKTIPSFYSPKERLRTMHQLACTCRYAQGLFQANLQAAKYLFQTVSGDFPGVLASLKRDPSIIWAHYDVTDQSGSNYQHELRVVKALSDLDSVEISDEMNSYILLQPDPKKPPIALCYIDRSNQAINTIGLSMLEGKDLSILVDLFYPNVRDKVYPVIPRLSATSLKDIKTYTGHSPFGRTFTHITGLQCTIWAGDARMQKMQLSYLNSIRIDGVAILLQQSQEWSARRDPYRLVLMRADPGENIFEDIELFVVTVPPTLANLPQSPNHAYVLHQPEGEEPKALYFVEKSLLQTTISEITTGYFDKFLKLASLFSEVRNGNYHPIRIENLRAEQLRDITACTGHMHLTRLAIISSQYGSCPVIVRQSDTVYCYGYSEEEGTKKLTPLNPDIFPNALFAANDYWNDNFDLRIMPVPPRYDPEHPERSIFPEGNNNTYVLEQPDRRKPPIALHYVNRETALPTIRKLSFLTNQNIATLTTELYPHINNNQGNYNYPDIPNLTRTQLQAIRFITSHHFKLLSTHAVTEAMRDEIELRNAHAQGGPHGLHFDHTQHLHALYAYVKYYMPWNYDQLREYWCKWVGGAQLIDTAELSYKHLTENSVPLPLHDEKDGDARIQTKAATWFTGVLGEGLSGGFAHYYRAWGEVGPMRVGRGIQGLVGDDLAAVAAHCAVRTANHVRLFKQNRLRLPGPSSSGDPSSESGSEANTAPDSKPPRPNTPG